MGDPCAVVADRRFPLLVRLHPRKGFAIRRFIVLHRNLRGHAPHCVRLAPMTRLDQQLRVASHEVRRHRHKRAVREAEVAAFMEFLYAAEDVVPASRVEAGRMVAKFVEDLVHLERGENRFDQHRRLDRASRQAELILRHHEHIVPKPCFEMAFELRQIKIRRGAACDQLFRVVKNV